MTGQKNMKQKQKIKLNKIKQKIKLGPIQQQT